MKRVSLALLALAGAAPLDAQSLMYRPPDLSGTWVSDGGVVQFNFVHRFHVFPGPTNTVINYPTFTLAAGIGHNIDFGLRFGTRSNIPSSGGSSNESEFFARWRVLGGPEGKEGFAIAVTPAYNKLAKSTDGEVGIDWTRGPFTLSGAARGMSKPLGVSGAKASFGGGVVARVTPYVALSADRSEEHTSELQSHHDLVCRLLLEKENGSPVPGQKREYFLGEARRRYVIANLHVRLGHEAAHTNPALHQGIETAFC